MSERRKHRESHDWKYREVSDRQGHRSRHNHDDEREHEQSSHEKKKKLFEFSIFPKRKIEDSKLSERFKEDDGKWSDEKPVEKNIDRIRLPDGSIDLGLAKHLPIGRTDMERKRRKMINYDTRPTFKENEEEKEESKAEEDKGYGISFEFGDRGSSWRMMKLSKLSKNPSKEEIFKTYATLWDYELACMERDEMEERRKGKSRHLWKLRPNEKFLKSKKAHYAVNKSIMGKIEPKWNADKKRREAANDEEDAVIEIKKHSAPISKSQKIRNELKLAKLIAMDYDAEEDDILSREAVERLAD